MDDTCYIISIWKKNAILTESSCSQNGPRMSNVTDIYINQTFNHGFKTNAMKAQTFKRPYLRYGFLEAECFECIKCTFNASSLFGTGFSIFDRDKLCVFNQ